MQILNLYPGSWGSNCYLLLDGAHAAVVDPSANADRILDAVRDAGATLEHILLTHGHFDHIVSIDALRERTKLPVRIHKEDLELPADAEKNAFYTFFHMDRRYRTPEAPFSEGDVFLLGDTEIRVLHTPGHTAGSACFLCGNELLLTGDVLFSEGIGRCDLFGSDPHAMRESLRRLGTLPSSLTIYPGHGEPAALGDALDRVWY